VEEANQKGVSKKNSEIYRDSKNITEDKWHDDLARERIIDSTKNYSRNIYSQIFPDQQRRRR